MPRGLLNAAVAPVPSAKPPMRVAAPATVDTLPPLLLQAESNEHRGRDTKTPRILFGFMLQRAMAKKILIYRG
jgi:hypothetical protein